MGSVGRVQALAGRAGSVGRVQALARRVQQGAGAGRWLGLGRRSGAGVGLRVVLVQAGREAAGA